jgi:hypothetical protein
LYTPLEPALNCLGVSVSRAPFYGPIKRFAHSWASTDNHGHTVAGTTVDVLAAPHILRGLSNAQAYDRAVVDAHRVTNLPEPTSSGLGEQALAYRGLLHLVCNPRAHNQTPSSELQAALQFQNRILNPNRPPPGCLVPLDSVRVRKLARFLEKLEVEARFSTEKAVLCTAYYLEPGIISQIVLKHLWSDRETVIEMLDSRLSLSGLPWAGLYSSETPLAGVNQIVLAADSNRMNADGQAQLVCWALTGSGTRTPTPACYWSVSDQQDLERGLWAVRGLNTPFFYRESLVSAPDLVCQRVIELTADGRLPARARALLQADGPQPDTLQKVLDGLRSLARYQAAREVEAKFGRGVLVHGPRADILITDRGLVHQVQAEPGTLITNFTMRGVRVVVFPDRDRDQVEFEIECQGRKQRVLIPEDVLGTGVKFADYLQRLHTDVDSRPPRVLDASKIGPVLHWARSSITDLPIVQGQSGLGWNGVRDRFSTADWVGAGPVREKDRPWSPDVSEFKAYARGLVEPGRYTDLPQAVCDIISTVVAQIQRHYMGYTNQTMEVLNNGANRRTLEILFQGLGQFRSLEAVTNGRQKPAPNLYGYPAWVLGMSRAAVRACDQPLWALGDAGVDWGPITDRDLERGAAMLALCVDRAVTDLMSGVVSLQEPVRRVLHRAALVEEGARTIRKTMELSVWPQSEPGYPHLERLLSSMDREQAKSAWMLDLRDQKLYLLKRACPAVRDSWDDMLIELATLVKGVKHCDVGAVMDPVSGQQFLTQYHNGEPPVGMMSLDWALAEDAAIG